MKKTVILILALLPIVLIITIAFAGKILSIYHHIPVDNVEFVNDVGEALDDGYILVVNVGEIRTLDIRVYPEMASNPKASFVSQDKSVCTVDDYGKITGVSTGGTTVLVKTLDGAKTDMINVVVIAERVTGVILPTEELTLTVGELYHLMPEIVPHTAINKSVSFSSDNDKIVLVSVSGQLVALSPGTATVTVTAADGGFTASCKVTVNDSLPPLSFDATGSENVIATGTGYFVTVDEIDLSEYIKYDAEKIDPSKIFWRIVSGSSATLDGSVISFSKKGLVKVMAYVGDPSNPTYYIQINLLRQ